MRSIEKLLSGSRHHDAEGLRRIPADDLARYVNSPANPWWKRRDCVPALAGRVPEQWVPELLARIRDRDEVGEVRKELLDVLGDRAELLPWLQHEDQQRDKSYGMREAFLKARGRLGDRSVTRELLALAASPWPHERLLGEAGLAGLVDRHGLAAILADLDDTRPQDRLFRVRMRSRRGENVTSALADPDRTVAYAAQSLVHDPDDLRDYLPDAPTTEARLWVAYALHNLTEETAETQAIHEALGRPRVEVDGLDEELRRAIVHEYARGCQPGSDPRWRVEVLCAEPPPPVDVDGQLERAVAALRTADLEPGSPVHCGDLYGQGDGTYHRIDFRGGSVLISTLGRFATSHDGEAARETLESAGFRWLDDATCDIQVTDLCVYFFGARDPLDVSELLFYWQD